MEPDLQMDTPYIKTSLIKADNLPPLCGCLLDESNAVF